jgi:outer membrane protein OmpA-like peptidoglycan-associated protein
MKALMLITGAVLFAGLGTAAHAGPRYSRDEVLNHFKPASDARGICIIGAGQTCGGAGAVGNAAAKAASSFNLAVTFEYNSDVLTSEAKDNLNEFAEALKDPSLIEYQFKIEGHTDAVGPDDYNVKLSRRRADAVAKYLTSHGVDRQRLKIFGLGKQNLIDPDGTKPINRRVEASIAE